MAKILVVEDDLTTNNLVNDYLTDAGHTVLSAYDSLSALKLFCQEAVALIILDIMLPNMDGLQVLKEIRKISNIPVLMLTALSDEKTQINSFDALADDYITKPFSMVLLGKRVLALLRRAGRAVGEDICFFMMPVVYTGQKEIKFHAAQEQLIEELKKLRLINLKRLCRGMLCSTD